MALPNPASQSGMVPIGMVQYQQASFKESIANAMKGFGELSTMRMLTKSPLLRMIGGGAIAEGVDLKRRERLAAAGRDPNTGRKLTKDELYEREARKKDLGALAEIKEILQALKIPENGGIIRVAVAEGGLGGSDRLFGGGDRSKQITIDAPTEDPYSIADEERAVEQEREDDEDQLESEERQQGFFTKLFMGMRPDRDGKGGGLFGLLGSLFGMLKGGLTGFLSAIIGPLFGVLGSMTSTIIGFLTPMITAVIPLLTAAMGVLLPIVLGGALGLLIADWIAGQAQVYRDKADVEDKKVMESGIARKTATTATGETLYKISDKDGVTKFGTAAELGLTPENIKQMEGGNQVDTAAGTVGVASFDVETSGGKETGKLAKQMSANEILAVEIARGNMSIEEANKMTAGQKKLLEIERAMAEYTSEFDYALANSTDNSAAATSLQDHFNKIANNLDSAARKFPSTFTPKKLTDLASKYSVFSGIIKDGKVTEERAYIDKDSGFIGMSSSDWDFLDSDDLVIPGKGNYTFGSKEGASVTAEGKTKGVSVDRSIPVVAKPTAPTPATMQGVPSPTVGTGAKINDLEAQKSAPPAVSPTNVIQGGNNTNTQNLTVTSPVQATPTGKDRHPGHT